MLVARTLAQQLSNDFEAACHPHQDAVSTRAGGEALARTLQARTQADPHLAGLLFARHMTLSAARPCLRPCARSLSAVGGMRASPVMCGKPA